MATPLHDQLTAVQDAANTVADARSLVEQATGTQTILAALEAGNALLTQLIALVSAVVDVVEPPV